MSTQMEVTEGGNDGEIVPKVGDSPAENSTASHKEAILQVSIEKEDVNGHDNDDDSTSESSKKHRKDKKKKKHKSDKRKHRDRSRERSSHRSRDKSPDRSRDRRDDRRDSSRDRRRRRSRSRDDSRDRRRSGGSRRSHSRSPYRRRSSSRDRRSSRERRRRDDRRDDRRDRSHSKDNRETKERTEEQTTNTSTSVPGLPTLKEIMMQNPSFSLAEAMQKQTAIKVAMGLGVTNPFTAGGIALGALMQPTASNKAHRELYLGNLPPGIQVPHLIEFLNAAMVKSNLNLHPGPSVLGAWVSADGHYAFVEYRTAEEATNAVNFLNGLQYGAFNLRIGRPRGYVGDPTAASSMGGMGLGIGTIAVPGIPSLNPALAGMMGQNASEDSNTLMLINLPRDVTHEQVRELVSPFGRVKAFNMITDPTGMSKGAAVFEYEDPSVSEGAIQGLNDLPLGDQKLSLQRVPAQMAATLLEPGDYLLDKDPTRTLRLSNMVTPSDLGDPEAMEEIKEDVADECNKYGTVLSVVAPTTGDGSAYVFVQFANADGCTRARTAIGGRMFNGNAVAAQYYPDELFDSRVYQPPNGYFNDK